MPLRKLIVGVGAALVFATGVAAAALADSPPTTTTTDTTTTSTTTTEPTTTTTMTTSTSTTSTETVPTTTTTSIETTTAPKTRSVTRPTTKPPHSGATPHGLARGAGVVASSSSKAGAPGRHKKHRKHRRKSKPLEVTPPLGQRHFVFPIVGPVGYGDSYGGERSDVRGGWHHGDDIFAPLGTPVVAVASGTINRVGWERVGGWRLWVRDSAADEFYYAHLSGYTRAVFHSRFVRAGQVIGFVGNTGDAFGGDPHLHFEIHPRQLLRLRYDGAVDPTTYLDGWTHLQGVHVPQPMHPRLPRQPQLRSEARLVFSRLLVARHLATPKPTTVSLPHQLLALDAAVPPLTKPLPLLQAAAASPPARSSSSLTLPLLGGFCSLAGLALAALLARLWHLRGRREEAAPEEPAA